MGHWARYLRIAAPFIPFEFTRLLRAVSALSGCFIILHPKSKNIFLALQGLPGKPHKKKTPYPGPFWERLKFTLYIQIRVLLRRRTLGARRRWPGGSIYTQCAVGVRFESPKNTIPPPRLEPFFEGFCATK